MKTILVFLSVMLFSASIYSQKVINYGGTTITIPANATTYTTAQITPLQTENQSAPGLLSKTSLGYIQYPTFANLYKIGNVYFTLDFYHPKAHIEGNDVDYLHAITQSTIANMSSRTVVKTIRIDPGNPPRYSTTKTVEKESVTSAEMRSYTNVKVSVVQTTWKRILFTTDEQNFYMISGMFIPDVNATATEVMQVANTVLSSLRR